MRHQDRIKAFTLVELSVVLMIISIVSGTLLSIGTKRSMNVRIEESEAKLKYIEDAVASYLMVHRSIPCPADATANQYIDAHFGVASFIPGNPHECIGTPPIGTGDGSIAFGSVPTKTLNISDDYAFDAWGRRITYAMVQRCNANDINTHPNFNAAVNFTLNCGTGAPSNGFIINNASSNASSDKAVLVLLSHGRFGRGAWNNNGSGRIHSGSDNAEIENSNDNHVFVQKHRDQNYEHIVRYKTRDALIIQAGGILSNSIEGNICSNARDVINVGANNICSASSHIDCESYLTKLAEQVVKICF